MNTSQYYLEFKNDIEERIKNGTFYSYLIHELYGPKITLPEQVLEIEKSIREAYIEDDPEFQEEYRNISNILNLSQRTIENTLQDPEKAHNIVRCLRDKLEEVEDKEIRAQAREKGFFAMIIYTIKKALAWIKKTFLDLKDSIVDMVSSESIPHARQIRRDYNWIQDYNKRSLERHTAWFDPKKEKLIMKFKNNSY